MVKVRKARVSELHWVNGRYDEVGFVHSTFENEIIAIAETNGTRAGVGRLVHVNGSNWELGGMYVLESFRGAGIAEKIVEFLLSCAPVGGTVFCLPFAHLRKFYGKFGFQPCGKDQAVPEEVSKKHRWCNQTYPHETLLLVLSENTGVGKV